MKNLLLYINTALIILSCQSSNQSSILPNSVKPTDKIDDYNAQFNSTFTKSQMYCLFQNSIVNYVNKNSSSSQYEFYTFIEDEEKYQKIFTCETIKTLLPKIDFSQDILVMGFNNKCRNVEDIKQYLVYNENQVLSINVVTKGQIGGGMGIGFISKIKKKDKSDIQVNFSYNYTK